MINAPKPGHKVFYQGMFECYVVRTNHQTRTAYLVFADHSNPGGIFAADFDLVLLTPEYLN